jgi:type I restriction enzyme R subunit
MILSNDKRNAALRLDEKSHVEEPLLQQLENLGWMVIRLEQKQEPQQSFRAHFSQVVLQPKLEEALRKINPFMRDEQVLEVIRRITTFPQKNLIENNRQVLRYLPENTTVSINYETGEQSPTVRFVDFRNRTNNSFLAIAQFKVKVPGTEHHIVPDIVLFINGLPVVVVECKSPKAKEPIAEAIDQLLRYSQQRGEGPEGNAELFYYNQFLVATCRQQAKFGTITTHIEKHFFRWTDPYPLTLDDLPHEGTAPNDQQRLVAGMCAKDNLLDLIRSFTIFSTNDKGQTVKVVGRYQQFRAVKLAIQRLLTGKNRRERSGIIWHTQGSGKSLTNDVHGARDAATDRAECESDTAPLQSYRTRGANGGILGLNPGAESPESRAATVAVVGRVQSFSAPAVSMAFAGLTTDGMGARKPPRHYPTLT